MSAAVHITKALENPLSSAFSSLNPFSSSETNASATPAAAAGEIDPAKLAQAVAELKEKSGVSGDEPAIAALGGKALLSERLTLDGLVAIWHPELQ